MKKNLRIVSAAAAALLAVAPVAATAVVSAPTSTVQAATTEDTVASMGKFGPVASNNVSVSGNLTGSSVPFAKETESAFTGSAAAKINPPKLSVQGNAAPVEGKYVSKSVKLDGKTPSKTAEVKAGNHIISADYTYTLASATTAATNATIGGVQVEIPANVKTITVTFSKAVVMEAKAVTPTKVDTTSYFVTTNGQAYANNEVVTASLSQNRHLFDDLATDNGHHVTMDNLKHAIKAVLNNTNNTLWSQVFGEDNPTSDVNLISQLRNAGFTVNGEGNSAWFNPGSTEFTITVRAKGGQKVQVVFANTDAVNEANPAFVIRSDWFSGIDSTANNRLSEKTEWSAPFNNPAFVKAIYVIQRDGGTFNPLDYIKAVPNVKTNAYISYTVKSNNVDWTKPGLYSVEVTATNAAKKSTDLTIPVVVSATNGKVMTAIKDGNFYREENGKMVQTNLVSNALHVGDQVRVFDTTTVDGVQYYRIGSKTANAWVLASDLKDGVVATPSQETTKTVTIMHISTIYDKNGKATHDPALRAYDTYSVVSTPVTLKDEKGNNAGTFYKLAGKDQYIKVGNVDGTSRSLKHNSYVYKSTGKRNGKKVLKKGSSVTTYGKSFMIAGHQMYRIGKNQYVKKANF